MHLLFHLACFLAGIILTDRIIAVVQVRRSHRKMERELAEILDTYRSSIGNPQTGTIFHSGMDEPMDFDKLAQRVIRPVIEGLGLEWYGWHGFRRGIASNLYELGANEKIVQRILRHAKPHVTKDRYIKAFDPAVLAAMKNLEATLDTLKQSAAIVQQVN